MPRVLIVDDDWFTRQLHSDYLGMEHLEVSVAEDSQGALRSLQEQRPDIVLTDIMMPGMDGVDLIRECRRRHPGVEIIVVTALNSVDVAVKALKAGAFDYLVKPVDAETLMFAVERGLEKARTLADNLELSRQLRLFQACQQLSTCLERDIFYRLALDSYAEALNFSAGVYIDFGSPERPTLPESEDALLGLPPDEPAAEVEAGEPPNHGTADPIPHLLGGASPLRLRLPTPRAGLGLSGGQALAVTKALVESGLVAQCRRGGPAVLGDALVEAARTALEKPEEPNPATVENIADAFDGPRPLTPTGALAVPIGGDDGLRGAIVLLRGDGERAFGPEDESQSAFLSRYVSFALVNIDKYGDALTLAYRDELTELWNVRYFGECLRREVARSKHTNEPFTVLFVDLDHFKLVNDEHGHLIGSRLLKEVARVVGRCVRDVDLVFRYGGDEFTLVLLNTDSAGGMVVGERLRSTLERHAFLCREGLRLKLTACVGVASFPEHAESVEDLIEMADRAMYQGKYTTRNAVYLASPQLSDEPVSRGPDPG